MSKSNSPRRPLPTWLIDDKKRQQEIREIWNNIDAFTTRHSVADACGINRETLRRWIDGLREIGVDLINRKKSGDPPNLDITLPKTYELTFEDNLQLRKLRDQVSSLKSDLKEAEKQALTSIALTDMIHEMNGATFNKSSDWLSTKPKKKSVIGIPTLFISDIHFDEYVDPAQIGYVNEYNREIATKRIQHVFKTAINILMNYMANPKYDGIVLALGGDLLSGNIHEELAETNEASILVSLLVLTDLLYEGILGLADVFKKVQINCVVGNHGRLHKKPRAKNRVFDNFEWLIYQTLAKRFADDDRVTFLIPDGPDCVFKVYDMTFLLTHGDQFRGGSGISGIFTPLSMGLYRKQAKQAAVHNAFDVMMLGHFHQYIHTNNIIVNGSIKGYDEWVNLMNFNYQRPIQSLWINNAEVDQMVLRTPILCDSYEGGYSTPEELIKRVS